MTVNQRLPGDLNVSTRFFGFLTWKDLLRVGLPLLLTTTLVYTGSGGNAVLLLLAGLLVGGAWYLIRPFDRPIDGHLYHGARWLLNYQTSEPVEVEEKHEEYVLLDDGTAVAVIEVSPTNLEMKTDAEQSALHNRYRELLNTVSYPLYIYSRQEPIHLIDYIDYLENRDPQNPTLDSYRDYCQQLAEGQLTQTNHYIAVRVSQTNFTWLHQYLPDQLPFNTGPDPDSDLSVNELDSRCNDIIQQLDSTEINAERPSGPPLHQLCSNQPIIGQNHPQWTTTAYNDTIGEYRRTLYIQEYPSALELAWPLTLLRANGQVDITQVVHPQASSDVSKQLQRLSEKLNAEIDSLLGHGFHGTNKLEGLLDDVNWFLNLLADREDQPTEYGVYITAHHPEKQQCLQTFEALRNRLDTLQIDYRLPVLRTDQTVRTNHVLHSDPVNETLLMPAGSAAAGFPFATQNTDQRRGIIYGVDQSDDTPVLLNRFDWSSHSMARMGMVGSGKSYAAKLELLRAANAYDDLQIIVVDPKQEYSRIIEALGGSLHELSQEQDYRFDEDVLGFTVDDRGDEENVQLLTEIVREIYRAVSQTQRKTLFLLDEARILLNDDTGRRILNQFVLEARDTNTAITLITQNASHFTHSREGREILDNMPGKIFMRHDRVPDSVVDYFDLSQREKQELFALKTGTESDHSEALLRVTGRINNRVRINATPEEDRLIKQGEDQ